MKIDSCILKNEVQKVFLTITILLSFAHVSFGAEKNTTQTNSKQNIVSFMPEDPCSNTELWNFGRNIPDTWKVKFTKPFTDEKIWLDYLFLANTMKNNSKTDEMKALGHYWMGRIYYNLNLYHLAYDQFSDIVEKISNSPTTIGSKYGALECMNKIENKFSSFQLNSNTLKSLLEYQSSTNNKQIHNTINELLIRNARKRISKMDTDPIVGTILEKLPQNSTGTYLLQILKASLGGNDLDTIRFGELFLKNISSSDKLKSVSDLVWLTIAQSYYNLGKYQNAATFFAKVSNSSNYFIQALIGLAWTELMLGNYNESTSKAYNFFSGPLKKTFAPDSNAVISIAFVETCNFPEAIESLNIFKKSYSKSHRWLYNWQQIQKSKPQNMYKMMADFFNKKGDIPLKIGNELARSPIFISGQEEINLIEDETKIVKNSIAKINKKIAGPKEKLYKDAANNIAKIMTEHSIQMNKKTAYILKRINNDFTMRTQNLVKTLAENLDNAKRIEAEVYGQIGEKMIVEQAIHETGSQDKVETKQLKKKPESAAWDWGRFPTQAFDENEDKVEIWQDEIGFLKTDITNKCLQAK